MSPISVCVFKLVWYQYPWIVCPQMWLESLHVAVSDWLLPHSLHHIVCYMLQWVTDCYLTVYITLCATCCSEWLTVTSQSTSHCVLHVAVSDWLLPHSLHHIVCYMLQWVTDCYLTVYITLCATCCSEWPAITSQSTSHCVLHVAVSDQLLPHSLQHIVWKALHHYSVHDRKQPQCKWCSCLYIDTRHVTSPHLTSPHIMQHLTGKWFIQCLHYSNVCITS